MRVYNRLTVPAVILLIFCFTGILHGQETRQLTFQDIMHFEDISEPVISDSGDWVAYSVWPDRGDGQVQIRSTVNDTSYSIERGKSPVISSTGEWVGVYIKPPFKEQLNAKKNKPRQGAAFLNTSTARTISYDSVKTFSFSNNGRWVALQRIPGKQIEKSDNKYLGTELILKNLDEGDTFTIPFVSDFAFDSTSSYLAYAVTDSSGRGNGLYYKALPEPADTDTLISGFNGYYNNLSWNDKTKRLAFTASKLDEDHQPGPAELYLWSEARGLQKLLDDPDTPEGWTLRSVNNLRWTTDGSRLFFGFLPEEMARIDSDEVDSTKTMAVYDQQEILENAGLDVWHWDDPRIKPHEKETWEQRKKKLYKAVYHIEDNDWVQLADHEMPDVEFTNSLDYALGSSDIPYLKEMTWNGFFDDYYIVDLHSGKRKRIVEKLRFGAEISPSGNYVVFYKDRNWHLYDVKRDLYRNLTGELEVPFFNEDHDYPFPVPGYGVGGWVKGDEAVLIYDKYDIWKFPTDGNNPVTVTDGLGRKQQRIFRIKDLQPESPYIDASEKFLLRSYHDKKKHNGFYTARVDSIGIEQQLEENKRFRVVSLPAESDKILYTRESYTEYPNLWVSSSMEFQKRKRLSRLHLDVTEKYDWGTAELVEWNSLDGEPLQGVLIKPGNYQEGKAYPVLIYYYRFFSQRLHEFNVPRNNHRPVFAQYASDGYAVFLPDIRFDVGTPGFAATKSLVPGVQELVDRGIADPDGLGLHGHSWSGYQTAFMITQTDIFDAAVAGAPVSNMTSAYSGIRWGSGLARQFQYEQTQSRIGGSLWEYPERYIENSPVFYADRINTPLMLQFGDEDGAVPWYQGIELYLAMRRLKKDAIFLQYHGEPHHLKKYPNKLDYAVRMKQYFDHYLKGEEAPDWITEGVPYRGE